MDVSALVDSILAVARAAAPVVGHGTVEAVELGGKIVEMIDHAAETFSLPPAVGEARDALEARVAAHVDEVEKRLRGTP